MEISIFLYIFEFDLCKLGSFHESEMIYQHDMHECCNNASPMGVFCNLTIFPRFSVFPVMKRMRFKTTNYLVPFLYVCVCVGGGLIQRKRGSDQFCLIICLFVSFVSFLWSFNGSRWVWLEVKTSLVTCLIRIGDEWGKRAEPWGAQTSRQTGKRGLPNNLLQHHHII